MTERAPMKIKNTGVRYPLKSLLAENYEQTLHDNLKKDVGPFGYVALTFLAESIDFFKQLFEGGEIQHDRERGNAKLNESIMECKETALKPLAPSIHTCFKEEVFTQKIKLLEEKRKLIEEKIAHLKVKVK